MIDSWQALTTYRSPQLVEQLVHAMDTAIRDKIEIMQICGTHTWNYRRHGLAALLPQSLSLVAGPPSSDVFCCFLSCRRPRLPRLRY